jgi:hypothetical protein
VLELDDQVVLPGTRLAATLASRMIVHRSLPPQNSLRVAEDGRPVYPWGFGLGKRRIRAAWADARS